jgi:Ca2+/Na+ antiporter
MTRSIGRLLIISWALYLLCFFPIRAESISVAVTLMILCAMAGVTSGVLAMRNANRWRLIFGMATMVLFAIYALARIRAAMMLGDAVPGSGAWTLSLKVFKTKTGMIEYLWDVRHGQVN